MRDSRTDPVCRFDADALAPRLWGPLEWLRTRPRMIDALAILVATVPNIVGLLLSPPPLAWLGYLLVVATGVALWWRRSRPFVVLAAVVVFASVNPLAQPGFGMIGLGAAVALYTVASRCRLPITLLGYLLSVTIPLATAFGRFPLGLPMLTPSLLDPTLLVAMVLGIAARARAGQRAALAELVNARIERAAATERNRITAEMHDVVAHSVTVMVALAGGARAGWQKHPERALDALEQLGNVGAHVLDEMQAILRMLRDGDADLAAALHESGHNLPSLQELVDTFRAAGVPVTLTQRGMPAGQLALQNTVYRVVQESLTNALRYARAATTVTVEITGERSELRITVTDDGQADPRQPSIGAGVGLSAMAERAAAFGGTHQAGPHPGGGWRTETVLPLAGDADGRNR